MPVVNIRFGTMAGRRISSQLFVRYSASVPADEKRRAVSLIINICNFIQQQLRADDFQIPPHRQAVSVVANLKMTKILTIILVFIGTIAFGQSAQIDTFRLEKSERFKDIQSDEMNFPVVRSGNKEIDSLINTDLKNRFTDNEYPTDNLDSTLIKWTGDQIVFLDFQVTYNENGILSINVSAEGCGAYCTSWTDYFNYSTSNGEWLNISDVIDNSAEFKTRVDKDKKEQYAEQKRLLKEILNDQDSGIDESTYEWALENYEDCEKNSDLESFAIYHDCLEIIEDCYLPNAIKNLTPIIELKYYFSEIREELKIKN